MSDLKKWLEEEFPFEVFFSLMIHYLLKPQASA